MPVKWLFNPISEPPTSTNLILSVGDPIGIGVLEPEQGEPIIPFPYYGPNDFVVHTLPVRPPRRGLSRTP